MVLSPLTARVVTRLRAIERPNAARLRANVKALGEQGRFHIDTVDFI